MLFKMDQEERSLLIEAMFYLALACFCVRFLPLKWYVNSLGTEKEAPYQLTHESALVSKSISKVIRKAANNVPWNAVCLPKAIAAKWMLRKRHIPSMLFLGVSSSNEAVLENDAQQEMIRNKPQLAAHAWLKTGDMVVTGKNGHEKFTPLKTFY